MANRSTDLFQLRPCIICKRIPTDRCHIKTKGSGGGIEDWNILFMCRIHHVESHKLGWLTFSKKHPIIEELLKLKGWYFNEYGNIRRDKTSLRS